MEYLANLTSAAKATYPLLASTSRRHQTSYLSPFPAGESQSLFAAAKVRLFSIRYEKKSNQNLHIQLST